MKRYRNYGYMVTKSMCEKGIQSRTVGNCKAMTGSAHDLLITAYLLLRSYVEFDGRHICIS
ncbi:hypothetical protein [Anaerotignum sp.]|uniref:hypothetical protein n=1 Tax=Anaerotignum sp. TaxID=2039241 RepID=UPI00289D4E6C|nr:hypothetical protein [Anaerotignum sp.]